MNVFVHLSILLPLLSFPLLSRVRASPPAPSPSASTELICHSALASECYSALFQPTEHFQRIHDDQSIPAGLHVRINLATGLKEARLNVPEQPGTPRADLAIVDVLPSRPSTEGNDSLAKIPELPDQSDPDLGYERLGPYYPVAFNAEESSLFFKSITMLHSTTTLSNMDLPTLSALQDLAHSIHWGVILARDSAVCQCLFSVIDPASATSGEIRSAAALLLGTVVHNNADALNAFLSHQYSSEASVTPVLTALAALRDTGQEDITLKTRTVFLLSQLCQNTDQLRLFLHSGGLGTLFDFFEPDRLTLDDGLNKFRTKATNFIYDRIISVLDDAEGLASLSSPEFSEDRVLKRGLEPWCYALTKMLEMYRLEGKSTGIRSPTAEAAFRSIQETNQALREVHAHFSICGNEYESYSKKHES